MLLFPYHDKFPLSYFFFVSVKTKRLRQAKEEAEREAALYRSNMESEYQNKISEVLTYSI